VSPGGAAVHHGVARALRRRSGREEGRRGSQDLAHAGQRGRSRASARGGHAGRWVSPEGAAADRGVVNALRRGSGQEGHRRGRATGTHRKVRRATRFGAGRAEREGGCSPRERRLETGQVTRFGAGAATGRAVEVDSRRTPDGETSHALRRGARRAGRWAWPEGAAARSGAVNGLRSGSGRAAGRRGRTTGTHRKVRRTARFGAGRAEREGGCRPQVRRFTAGQRACFGTSAATGRAGAVERPACTGRRGRPRASARGGPDRQVGVARGSDGSRRGCERASAREQPRGGPARSAGLCALEGRAGRALRRGAGQVGRWVQPEGSAASRGVASALRRGRGREAGRRGWRMGAHSMVGQATHFGAGRAGPEGGCRPRERRLETGP
jgi:hypothetical protein